MRITEIHVYQHDLPVVNWINTSFSKFESTIVRIVTETGLEGYGETCPLGPVYQPMHALGIRSALQQMGPNLIGLNALGIECIHDAMEASLNGFRYAKAAVDIALWDLAGKAYNVRVCDLLGGARQERVS